MRTVIACLALVYPCQVTADTVDPIVEIRDENLRRILLEKKNKYGQMGDELTQADLRNVYILHASNEDITDLTGLEYCTHLGEARLANNAITDLTPLAGCGSLQSLDLSRNQVTDLTPLAANKKLQYLTIEHNNVQSLQAVVALSALDSLYASRNEIDSLEPVRAMTNLWSLDVSHNQIENTSPAKALTRLSLHDVSNNPREDAMSARRPTEHPRATGVGRIIASTIGLSWKDMKTQVSHAIADLRRLVTRIRAPPRIATVEPHSGDSANTTIGKQEELSSAK